ncbi:MAG: hypothetical protein BWY79_01620 [Actinobacteria bacterium ADurb.Bin444]|nr:MAG: hypothetical protein BWY79_01620 [Actinobacteria bacterium ADurb.Bin444]
MLLCLVSGRQHCQILSRQRTRERHFPSCHALQDDHQPKTARIDYAGVGQYFQQLWGTLNALPPGLDHALEQFVEGEAGSGGFSRLGHLTQHSEHGSFHRLAHGSVRCVCGPAQNSRQQSRTDLPMLTQFFHRPAHHLREDDPTVPAGAHERGLLHGCTDIGRTHTPG